MAFFILYFMCHSEHFQKYSVCVHFDFVSCHILRKSLHTLLKRQW